MAKKVYAIMILAIMFFMSLDGVAFMALYEMDTSKAMSVVMIVAMMSISIVIAILSYELMKLILMTAIDILLPEKPVK